MRERKRKVNKSELINSNISLLLFFYLFIFN